MAYASLTGSESAKESKVNQISIVINFIIKIYFAILKVYRLSLLPSWLLYHSCNWSSNFRLNYSFRLSCRCFKSDSIFHIIVQHVNISVISAAAFHCHSSSSANVTSRLTITFFVIGLYSLYPPCLYPMKMVFTILSSNFDLPALGT